ncbi:MAG: SseB family protein [Lachnospiraceae bacterium]|nr:SseB family protein [Lachnospiraceae bacterium]
MIDHTFAVKKIQNLEEAIVIFSQQTRMPFVECDEETYDDQVHMFANESEVQEFAKMYTEKKILLMAVKVLKAQMRSMYNTFYSIGANAVVFHENGNVYRLQLKDIEKMPDLSKLMKEKLPVVNPTLQLSTLYFLQEMYRPVKHDMQHAKELEEEMLINLMRSRYILPLENVNPNEPVNPKDPKQKKKIPYVKDKDGNMLMPIFSDFTEFQKFYRDKATKMGMGVQGFTDLPNYLAAEAKGLVLNPGGFHLHITKEQLDKLVQTKKEK